MTSPPVWDAIIVGGRVAGAVTAIGLARRGHRVLVLDRDRFPSDTLSTHSFGPETTLRFGLLDLLDEIEACGAPPMHGLRMAAPEHGVEFTGRYQPQAGVRDGYSIRRIVLDDLLVRAARAAGAEVREQATVAALRWLDGQAGGLVWEDARGQAYVERCQVVIGADGRYSRVARWARAETYASAPPEAACYYAYFRDAAGPRDRFEHLHTAQRDYLVQPTDSGLTCLLVCLPQREASTYRQAHQRNYLDDVLAVPELAERFGGAERVGPVRGATDCESYLRVPIGPGWALVGDAGARVHPIGARGISNAVRDGMLLTEALSAALQGLRDPAEALSEFHALRDADTRPAYEQALAAAQMTGRPLKPETLALWSALALLPDEADDYINHGATLRSPAHYHTILDRARALAV